MIHHLTVVAEFIGYCVMIPGALLGLTFVLVAGLLWLRGPEPVQLERRLGLVVCDCGRADCPTLAGRWSA